jgi:hypothetical protein
VDAQLVAMVELLDGLGRHAEAEVHRLAWLERLPARRARWQEHHRPTYPLDAAAERMRVRLEDARDVESGALDEARP